MKALVTGGAGFIGSNLCSLLINEGYKVRVIDNLSSGYVENLNPGVEFIHGDICNQETIGNAVRDCDVVFHLAASVGRQKSLDKPIDDATINYIGTLRVLEAMREGGVRKIVYSSSAAIFGELITQSIDESHPQNADSPYGVSKLAAEKAVLAYSLNYGISAICLRYFNIYGMNQRFDVYGNVIPIFAERIFSSQNITIYGDGEQTRDFLNVHDVALANILAAKSNLTSEIVNLGSGQSITINTLANSMLSLSNRKATIEYAPTRKADVRHCRADISKAKRLLGFNQSVSLDDGLKEYLAWYERVYTIKSRHNQ